MSIGEVTYPYLDYRFIVEAEKLVQGGFSEVTGLLAEVEMEDYREGGQNDYIHHLPKSTRYQNITLKKGLFDIELWNWHRDVRQGKIERSSVSIILLDVQGNEAIRWVVNEAFPSRWTGPDLRADSGTIAAESIELVHKGIEVA